MLLKLLGILATLFGCIDLYLCHPNQTYLSHQLSKPFIFLGWICLFTGLVILLLCVPKLVAFFVWFAVITLIWAFLPILNLLKRSSINERT
jgi:hypothetical protein